MPLEPANRFNSETQPHIQAEVSLGLQPVELVWAHPLGRQDTKERTNTPRCGLRSHHTWIPASAQTTMQSTFAARGAWSTTASGYSPISSTASMGSKAIPGTGPELVLLPAPAGVTSIYRHLRPGPALYASWEREARSQAPASTA